jgi:hypothetical protein
LNVVVVVVGGGGGGGAELLVLEIYYCAISDFTIFQKL